MARHEWREAALGGKGSVEISAQGLEILGQVIPWADLTEVSFVRYTIRGGRNEELTLHYGQGKKRLLKWAGDKWHRADWQAMLLDFSGEALRHRPDLSVTDGPNAAELRTARRIGIGVSAIAATIMAVILLSGPGFVGGMVAVWVGVIGIGVGVFIYNYYNRKGPPPQLDWGSFAVREGQAGDLPPN